MSIKGVHDRELLDILDGLEAEVFSGATWRTTWKGRDPLLGGKGGGRWSPNNSFEALYTSLDKNVSLAELYYHLSRAPVFSSRVVVISELHVDSVEVLNLTEDTLKRLGVEDATANSVDYTLTQAIGAAANFLEYQGVLVPSARRKGVNLMLFPERLDLNTSIVVNNEEDINWPAWVEHNK